MSLQKKLRSQLLNLYLDYPYVELHRRVAEWRRRITGKPHQVSVFLQLDDPYSYLLSHYLPQFAAHYAVLVKIYLAQTLGNEYTPQPGMLAEYAVRDCQLLARELGVPFLDKGPAPAVEHRRALLNALASEHESDNFPETLRTAHQAKHSRDRGVTVITESLENLDPYR